MMNKSFLLMIGLVGSISLCASENQPNPVTCRAVAIQPGGTLEQAQAVAAAALTAEIPTTPSISTATTQVVTYQTNPDGSARYLLRPKPRIAINSCLSAGSIDDYCYHLVAQLAREQAVEAIKVVAKAKARK